MVALLGQGVSGYLVTTDDTMIVTNGGDPSLIKAAVEAAQNGEGLEQNLGIGESRTGLPEDRVAEVYLDVGSVMRMARSLVALFAPEMQIEVPEDLPPSAGSLSVRDSGMAARMYVPMKVVSALTDALRELQGGNGGDDSVSRKEDGSPSGRSKALLSFSGAQFERQGVKASRNQPVVVGMWAPWSEPSKKQVEILDTLAERYEGRARLGTVNIDEHPKLGQRYELDAVPTILIFKDGKVTRRMTGVTSARKLSEHIDAVLAE